MFSLRESQPSSLRVAGHGPVSRQGWVQQGKALSWEASRPVCYSRTARGFSFVDLFKRNKILTVAGWLSWLECGANKRNMIISGYLQNDDGLFFFFFFYFFFVFLLFVWAAPAAYGGSQARG